MKMIIIKLIITTVFVNDFHKYNEKSSDCTTYPVEYPWIIHKNDDDEKKVVIVLMITIIA